MALDSLKKDRNIKNIGMILKTQNKVIFNKSKE